MTNDTSQSEKRCIRDIAPQAMEISQKLEGAASLLEMLEDKVASEPISDPELSAVRCIIETCAKDLDELFADC